ncbi:MFS transporter, partial [Xanthomonas graminis]|uniref:MFS transporter n=1 Tax=Xanthomonas graminis TaxID=3390026 RepID=UPI0039647974
MNRFLLEPITYSAFPKRVSAHSVSALFPLSAGAGTRDSGLGQKRNPSTWQHDGHAGRRGSRCCAGCRVPSNVALGSIAHTLHASATALELIVAVYGVAFAVGLAADGRLGDNLGRRRVFAAGVLLFAVASLL